MRPFKPLGKMLHDVFVTKVATLAASGVGQQKIAKIISEESGEKFTWRDVQRALETERAKDIVDDVNKSVINAAKFQARAGCSRLVGKALSVVEHNLKKNNLRAAMMVFETVGALEKNDQEKASAALTVIMPGASNEKQAQEVQGDFVTVGENQTSGVSETVTENSEMPREDS